MLVVTIPKTAVKMKETRKRTERNGMRKVVKSKRRTKSEGRRKYQPKRKGSTSIVPNNFSNQPPTNFPTSELRL